MKLEEAKKVISKLDVQEFDSHQFIQKYAHYFEAEYIDWLYENKTRGGFREVHRQIGVFLNNYTTELGLEKLPETIKSTNPRGYESEVHQWRKITNK